MELKGLKEFLLYKIYFCKRNFTQEGKILMSKKEIAVDISQN